LPTPGAESLPTDAEASESAPAAPAGAARGVTAVFAPCAVTLAALLLHRLLPDRQPLAPPTRTYPLVLEVLLASAGLLLLAQWLWKPLRPWARHRGPLYAGAIALLGLWDAVTLKATWLPLPYFPGPDMVLQAIWDDRLLLLESTYCSLRLLLIGYLSGVALGFVSGVCIGWSRQAHYWGVPLMKIIGPIPATALIPLAMVLFSTFLLTSASLIAYAVWFPVATLTMSGIRNVPASYFDVARTLGAGRRYLIFHVAIPAAMPSIFIGVFIGLLVSFLTVVVAESVGVKNGLGYYVVWKRSYAEFNKVYGALAIMAVFYSSILTLLFKVRDRVLKWQKGFIRW
jgi:NitT/TauT family transport system permease protein